MMNLKALRGSSQRLPAYMYLLLGSQLFFNIGFYLVVPFLAVELDAGFAATGALIGLVLGLRTFSQQGFFFLGGGIVDLIGARRTGLIGIALRVLGFLVTGYASWQHTSVGVFILGVVLIGFAAALFSPAVETSLASAGGRLEAEGVTTRTHIFALDSAVSTTGASVGPLLGALLLPFGFPLCCAIAAGLFTMLFFAHLFFMPASVHPPQPDSRLTADWGYVLRDRTFLVLAASYSTCLVAYNQLYLALPVELVRATGSDGALSWMFLVAGLVVIFFQVPVARVAVRVAPTRAVAIGCTIMAASFLLVAVCAPFTPSSTFAAYAPVVLWVMIMNFGYMIAAPVARNLVGVHAREQKLGSYYGVLNSAGGVAVLITSPILGPLLDHARTPGLPAIWPWVAVALLMAVSAIVFYFWRMDDSAPARAPSTEPETEPPAQNLTPCSSTSGKES